MEAAERVLLAADQRALGSWALAFGNGPNAAGPCFPVGTDALTPLAHHARGVRRAPDSRRDCGQVCEIVRAQMMVESALAWEAVRWWILTATLRRPAGARGRAWIAPDSNVDGRATVSGDHGATTTRVGEPRRVARGAQTMIRPPFPDRSRGHDNAGLR